MNPDSPKHLPNAFIVILIGGLLISIGLSWVVFSASPNSARPPSSVLSPTINTRIPTNKSGSASQTVFEVGKPAPDFSLKDINGKEIHLSDFSGKAVMINMWASWCIPCQEEMPEIENIFEKYNTSDLMVLGINVTSQDHMQDVKDTVKKYQLSYPILLDESGQVSSLYHMYGIPSSYFIDTQGILRRIQIGEIRPNDINGYFSEIIPRK